MAPNGSQMAPKSEPGLIFGFSFFKPSKKVPKKVYHGNFGHPIWAPFRPLFVPKSILTSFLGVQETYLFFVGVLERPGLQNDAKKVSKNDSKTHFFHASKTAIGYGIYCTDATRGGPGRVPKTLQKKRLQKRSKKCLRGSFLSSIFGAIWDHFRHIFAFGAKKRPKKKMQKKSFQKKGAGEI